jgi:hypothetical protein
VTRSISTEALFPVSLRVHFGVPANPVSKAQPQKPIIKIHMKSKESAKSKKQTIIVKDLKAKKNPKGGAAGNPITITAIGAGTLQHKSWLGNF